MRVICPFCFHNMVPEPVAWFHKTEFLPQQLECEYCGARSPKHKSVDRIESVRLCIDDMQTVKSNLETKIEFFRS